MEDKEELTIKMNAVHFYWDVQISPNAGEFLAESIKRGITACASDISSTLLIEMFDLSLSREGRSTCFLYYTIVFP